MWLAANALQRGDELARLFPLSRRSLFRDFLQDLARAVLVADLEVRLRELELRADCLAAGFGGSVEAQVSEVHRTAARGGGCRGRSLGRLGRREIESRKVEIEGRLL